MAKDSTKSEEKLSPKEYRERLEKIRIQSIYLLEGSAKLVRERLVKSLNVNIDIAGASYGKTDNNIIEIISNYKVFGYETKKSDYAVLIKSTFILSVIDPESRFDDDFFKIFKEVNLKMNVWPYLREFVQNMTQRLNLPPLTLPFYKI